MELTAEKHSVNLDLKQLPGLAKHILESHLDEYVKELLHLSRTMNLPILKFFDQSNEDALIALSKNLATQYLTLISQNDLESYISLVKSNWLDKKIPHIAKYEVVAEDIEKTGFIRKQAFLKFVPKYTADINEIMSLVRELDLFSLELDRTLTTTYARLLHNRIDDHNHLIEKITQTTPGIIYVFDLINKTEIYTNKRSLEQVGYNHDELNMMGSNLIKDLIHPEDVSLVENHIASLQFASDGEIKTVRYRVKTKHGPYLWMRNFESVFKRDDNGNPIQSIGIAIDVDNEKRTADALKYSREQLLEAQELAGMGNIEWNVITNRVQASPNTYRILGVNEGDTPDTFFSHVHPDDREKMMKAIVNDFKHGAEFETEFRYMVNNQEKIFWSRAKVVDKEDGLTVSAIVIDITDRHNMLAKLEESQELYKEAQAVAHIGNYSWNVLTGEIEWSDELKRIFGLKQDDNDISYSRFISLIYEKDRENVKAVHQTSLKEKKSYDFIYRIYLNDNTLKYIHSRGNVMVDPSTNEVYRAIGTAEDVTQRQLLIERLQQNEAIYKQAETLSRIGNWRWNLVTNEVEWTDGLYLIYGMEPQSEPIDLEKFKSFVHPDDKERVESGIKKVFEDHTQDYTFRIIARDGKVKTIRSIAQVQFDEHNKPSVLIGTEQDVTEREDMIARMRESQGLYKQAQVLNEIGNWKLNLKTNELEWSDELYRIYELDPALVKITREISSTFRVEDDSKRVEKIVQKAIETLEPYEFYYDIVTAKGRKKKLRAKGEIIQDNSGKAAAIFGTVQDVTERQALIEKLQESEELYKQAQSIARVGNWTWDMSIDTISWSDELYRIFGLEPGQKLDYNTYISYVLPEDVSILESSVKEAIENNQPYDIFHRIKWNDGTIRTLHSKGEPLINSKGEVYKLIGTAQDVTEQQMIEQQLRDNQRFIQNIAEASPTILYLYDVQQNRIVYINQEITFVIGYTPEEIIELGNSFRKDLYHPDDISKLPEKNDGYTDLAKEEESMFQYECRMKAKNGQWRWLLVREIVFTRDKSRNPLQVLGAAIDISDRREIEQTLQIKNLELEQSNTSLEEFAYVASHDLQEPLRKISVFGDRLLSIQNELSKEGQLYLKKIIDSSLRMQKLIDDLLIISRISHDKSFKNHSLQAILKEVLQLLDHKIEKLDAQVIADELPTAEIIPLQFKQLFQNLLSNSLKFVKEGVKPEIRITSKQLLPSEASQYGLQKGKKYIHLEFTDNGIGFENEYATKIFAIFQRLHGRSEYEGTGIGLAICKKIVENHSGVIFANSELDKGAVFTIIIPEEQS